MELIGIISDYSGVLILSLCSKAGTVAVKVRVTLQPEIASDKWLNPVVQFTDLSRISKRQNSFADITQVKCCAEHGNSLFLCPPRKSGVGWGDREVKNIIGPGSFQFFSFQKKTEKQKEQKKRGGNLCLQRGDPHLVIIVGAFQQSKGDSDEDIYLQIFHSLCNVCSKLMQARTHFC